MERKRRIHHSSYSYLIFYVIVYDMDVQTPSITWELPEERALCPQTRVEEE